MTLGAQIPPPLAALAPLKRFVTYETYPDPDRPGKTIKRPTDVRTGHWCDSNKPEHQYSYGEAVATGRPIGFVFVKGDGFFFVDIDGALKPGPAGGLEWSALSAEICAMFPGAYVEVSQSTTGLHILGRGAPPEHSNKNILLNLELYTDQRFCALTGASMSGDVGTLHQAAITDYATRWFPPNVHGAIAGWTDGPVPEWTAGLTDDADLLRAAMASGKKKASAAFGNGTDVLFSDLWDANAEVLAKKWPGNTDGYGASEADIALASHLGFWTGKNCERTRDLMFQSGLARQKWEDRPDWLETTIMRAFAVVKNVAKKRDAPPPPGMVAGVPTPPPAAPDMGNPIALPPPPAATDVARTIAPPPAPSTGMVTVAAASVARMVGREYMPHDEQTAYFAGCCYVVRDHKIWVPGTGELLDKARFDVVYGGHIYPLDVKNEKMSDSSFDAFTKNMVYEAPRARKTCFRPELPSGSIIISGGWALLNGFIPIQTLRRAGDVSKFTNHLAKLLPNDRDRSILTHWMASALQNPGRKFQWAPLIQGTEGNGKSLINRVMQFAVGARYSHLVNPDAMAKTGNQFNSWIENKMYVGIEEIYVNNRRDFLETFKTTVTDDVIPLEGKGMNQETGDNRANICMFSNHKDAIPITTDTRRYCILYTAQQNYEDVLRDGMGGDYFPDLYDWFYGRGQYAQFGADYGASIINEWLRTLPLSAELDPARQCIRAPETSSTATARSMSLGRAELEILEAVEEGRPGFNAGWLSSIMVDRLLDTIRVPVSRNKRREMIEGLGFILHPGLEDGRVTSVTAPDNGKPRLYVRPGHLSCNLTDRAAIAKAYTNAQTAANNDQAAARFGS